VVETKSQVSPFPLPQEGAHAPAGFFSGCHVVSPTALCRPSMLSVYSRRSFPTAAMPASARWPRAGREFSAST